MTKATTKPVTKKPTVKKEIPENVDPVTGEILDAPKTTTQKDIVPAKLMDPLLDQEDQKIREIVKSTKPSRESALSIVGGVTTAELTKALETQTEQRALIQKFIKDNLVEGVDYGKIHVVSSCPAEKQARGSCQKDYHFSKAILFKPGQEKIFSLFGITDELERDEKVYEMLGQVAGMVAFKCTMYRGDNRVGEGRGAATMGGSQNDPNSCIKKAEKRARMDACLSLGFSAYFTQDLDDPDYKSQREMMNERAKHEAEAIDKDENGFLPRAATDPIDNKERALLHRLITQAGFEDRDEIIEMLKANGIKDASAMTSGEARKLIKKMQAAEFLGPDTGTDTPDPEPESDDVDDEPVVLPTKKVQEAELVLDEDLKANVQELYNQVGFNGLGKMWFFKHISGKPFGDWSKISDPEWRKAYQHIMDIMDNRVDVDQNHLASDREDIASVDYGEPSGDVDQIQAEFPGAEDLNAEEEAVSHE